MSVPMSISASCPARWMGESCESRLVSVIVPAMNRAGVMEPTLRSILEQDYRPIEIVLVDDGSTDRTREWVAAWTAAHEELPGFEVRYIAHPSNLGAPAARNSGLRASRGEFIQFLDSDDLLRGGKLRMQVDRFDESPDLDYVYGRTDQVGQSDRIMGHVGAPMDMRWPARNIPRHLWHVSGVLYRRQVCVDAGPWNEDLCSSEDWEYAARIKSVSQRGQFLHGAVSLYVIHDGPQMIKEASRRVAEARRRAIWSVLSLLEKAGDGDEGARDMCARALVANAIGFRSIGNAGEMRNALLDAMRIGGVATRIAAGGLYSASFVLPGGFFTAVLRMARVYRHASS